MGSETRARLGLAALLVATLASFEQLFARSDYFGPAFLGLLLAAGIAMGGRRLGAGTLATILISAAGLFWYLALVFEAPRTLYGLPTPGAAAGLAAAVIGALDAANLDFAPIPSRAGYVILVVVGMWVATTTAEIATFRWRRPLLATAPALGLFAFDLVVADPAGSSFRVALWLAALLTYLGLESSHRLSSWGRYITTWRDKQPEPDPVTGRLARRMAAACVIAAVASPVFLPALEGGMFAWRSDTGGGAPGGGGVGGGGRIDLLATLVPGALSRSAVELFEVDAAEAAKWRLASLSHFDGDTWHPVEGERRPASEGFPAAAGLQVPTTRLVQRVRIAGLDSDYLPAASTPAAIAFPDSDIGLDEVQIEDETQDLRFGRVDDGLTYEVTSVIPRLSYRALARAELGAPGEEYTQGPALSPEVRALRNRWIRGADGPFEELVRIQEKLRGPAFTYSQSVSPSASNDYLAHFLTDTRRGFCQQFAAAFAVLARSLGYPTRLSIGFLPGEVGDDPDHYIVLGTHAHAWPEVHFQGFGWVPFEPTPRSSSLAPDYTSAPLTGAGEIGGQIPGVSPDGAPVPGQARIRNEANEPLLGPPAPPIPAESDAWRRAFDRVARAALLVLVAWLATVPALKEWRWRRRYRRAHTSRGAVIAAFDHFVEEASELATAPRPTSESAVAYARRVTGNERGPAIPALDLARLYEKAEYGATEVSPADARRARALARLLRSRLWASASWWERATRLFAPTGLRGFGEWRPRRAYAPERPREHDRAA